MSVIKWCESINKKLDNTKKIVLIAGASSSGKSFCSEKLAEHLTNSGKKTALIPADMYYKGISATIVEKAFVNNKIKYKTYLPKAKAIIGIVRNIIENDAFADKFSLENIEKIKNNLSELVNSSFAEEFSQDLTKEFSQINFDEPFAINFRKLNNDINKLINNKNIIVPTYSFKTGEIYSDKKNLIKPSDYNCFIIEGLYTLRNEVLNNIDKKYVLKSAIDCDLKTLLVRRFNRDIKSNRVSYTPEKTIISFLTQVMPSYYNHIYPTLKNADILLNTSITKEEIAKRETALQVKYKAPQDIFETLKAYGASLTSFQVQKDYFIEDTTMSKQNDIILRLRQENGLATKLSIKFKTKNPEERAIEEYDLTKYLSKDNRKIDFLLAKFIDSGYDIMQVINKNRKNFVIDDVKIKLDTIDYLGTFVEFEGKTLEETKELASKFALTNPKTSSYYDLFQESQAQLPHLETEMKFKVEGISQAQFAEKYTPKFLKQYYLDLNKKELLLLIQKTFEKNITFAVKEARIRIINNDSFVLTLKSDGKEQRYELEKEIPVTLAKKFLDYSNKSIEKTRYTILNTSGLAIEFDFYKNSDLTVMEIEYDSKKFTKKQITTFAKTLTSKSKIQDITKDLNYKNKNLAK